MAYSPYWQDPDPRWREPHAISVVPNKMLNNDLRLAIRNLVKSPRFTLVAAGTLALGIGASTAMYSFLSGVLLAPLPWKDPGSLLILAKGNPNFGFENMWLAGAELQRYSDSSSTLGEVSGFSQRSADLIGERGAQRLWMAEALPGLLQLVGREPLVGRSFLPEEYEPGGERVVLLAYDFWQDHFGGDDGAVGESLALDDGAYVVIGVLPPGPTLPLMNEAEIVTAAQWTEEDRRDREAGRYALGVARLAPGVALEAALEELATLQQGIETEQPSGMDGWRPDLVPLPKRVVGDVEKPLWILFGAVLVVLLAACVNVANLLVFRGRGRLQEIAVRRALGASTGRVVRQLLVENSLLGALGGVLGVGLAFGLHELLLSVVPSSVPRLEETGLDAGVLGFALLAVAVSTLVFGLLPALTAARAGRLQVRPGVGQATVGDVRVREALSVAQVALALVLLIGAGLLAQSLFGLLAIDPGFEVDGAARMTVQIPDSIYEKPADQRDVLLDVVDATRATAGIDQAAATAWIPLSGSWGRTSIEIEGQPPLGDEPDRFAYSTLVTDGYLDTMQIPLLSGRDIERADLESEKLVAVVNRTFAERFWKSSGATGKRFRIGGEDSQWIEVIGVAADVRSLELGATAGVGYYMPYNTNMAVRGFQLVARGALAPSLTQEAMRSATQSVDRSLPIGSASRLDELVGRHLAGPRFHLTVLGILAGLALILAILGIYSVVAVGTSQRIPEIGVRMALGADRRDLVLALARRGALLVALGLAVGIVLALATSRLLASLLHEIDPTEVGTYVAVSVVLGIAGVLAVLVPSIRASRIDPATVLRSN